MTVATGVFASKICANQTVVHIIITARLVLSPD
jgi:hypothetical protein